MQEKIAEAAVADIDIPAVRFDDEASAYETDGVWRAVSLDKASSLHVVHRCIFPAP